MRTALLVAVAALIGALVASGVMALTDESPDGARVVERSAPAAPSGSVNGTDVVSIAEDARPAIVHIQVSGTTQQGSGSGFIVRSDGIVMTNNHVVQGGNDLTVELSDGRTFDAEFIGGDPQTDVAVLRIDGEDLPVATLSTAKDLQIGQPTIAIGNPLGLSGGPSVSVGIVSAMGRNVQVDSRTQLVDMIQTDAAISPGSSGGALLDANGSVIGITTAIGVSEAGAEGIGFATPIDIAKKVADDLLENGEVLHPFLGVSQGSDDGRIDGAVVGCVEPDFPAADAGIQEGDVIVAVDGESVSSFSSLRVLLRTYDVGDEVTVTVQRGGDELDLTLKLQERPSSDSAYSCG